MKVILRSVTKEEHSLDVDDGCTVGQLRAKADSDIGAGAGIGSTLIFKGTVLKDDGQALSAAGVADGDFIIMLAKKGGAASAASPSVANSSPAAPPAAPAAAASPAAPAAPPAQQTASGALISLTVATEMGEIIPVEVQSNETIDNVKAVLEVETNIPMTKQTLMFEGKALANNQTLNAAGIKDNDMLLLQVVAAPVGGVMPRAAAAPAPAGAPGGILGNLFGNIPALDPVARFMDEANQIMQMAQADTHMLRRLKDQAPEVAQAIEKGDTRGVAVQLMEISKKKRENESRKQAAIMRLNADPMDVEAQREIENAIAMENINANMEQAMEYNPESFASVVMLYIDCEVHGIPVKAFVDSGAQMTIMGVQTAERLGLMRLVDKRYAGVAKGVGTSKIVGKIHSVQMKLGNTFFPISISVLEDNKMDFLFGLDNLRKHQCCIDLKDSVLRIGEDAVPFLSEGELDQYTKKFTEGNGDEEMAEAGAPGNGEDYPQDVVERFTNMGFSKEQAVAALRSSGGDAELAASLLLSGFD